MLRCERRTVSASIVSRSCFASFPVCIYKFSSHYLNNIIFYWQYFGASSERLILYKSCYGTTVRTAIAQWLRCCAKKRKIPRSIPACYQSGNLNFLEPSGPLQPCNWTALPFYENTVALVRKELIFKCYIATMTNGERNYVLSFLLLGKAALSIPVSKDTVKFRWCRPNWLLLSLVSLAWLSFGTVYRHQFTVHAVNISVDSHVVCCLKG